VIDVFRVPVAVERERERERERESYISNKKKCSFVRQSDTHTQCNLKEIRRAENKTALFGIY